MRKRRVGTMADLPCQRGAALDYEIPFLHMPRFGLALDESEAEVEVIPIRGWLATDINIMGKQRHGNTYQTRSCDKCIGAGFMAFYVLQA